jgi:hypothetical protein
VKPINKPTKRMHNWSKDLKQALEFLKDNNNDKAIIILHRVISQMSGHE